MAEKARIRKMFPGGNTSQGFYSLFHHVIAPDAQRIFVIKGGPGVGKSTFMKAVEDDMVQRGFEVEEHHCSSDPASLDGLVIPSIGVALLDGTAPHVVDPKHPAVVDEIIHLGNYWDTQKILPYKAEVLQMSGRMGKLFRTAYSLLRESKVAYDEAKGYVEDALHQGKYNRIVKILLETVLEGVTGQYNTVAKGRHLFASAITPEGLRNYIDTLIAEDMQIYTVKGAPGTGAKELISRIAQGAEEMGLYTEQYHCPYEPDKLDMVILPAMRRAVIHGSLPYHTDPAEFEGIHVAEEINLDLCVDWSRVDDDEADRRDALTRMDALLNKAIDHIGAFKQIHDEMEQYYIEAMDFAGVNRLREDIVSRIMTYAD